MTTILVAEDDPAASLTRTCLAGAGYTVESASNGAETVRRVRDVRPDLIILDLMLQGPAAGWEACRRVREDSDVPIIILAAGTDEVDTVVGLELGADDHVTKPFNPQELVARVRAVLRRSNRNHVSRSVLAVADVRVDPERYEVTIGGQPVALPPIELRLLAILARRPGVVVPRDRLLQLVWPGGRSHTSRALDVHISWLRQKLGESGVRIVRVWGVGYRLVVTRGSSAGTALADLTRP